uniref:Protein MEMO1 n=1 Tax=Meloidogyne hapla TaxID=6305 RepID=A0A1I8B3Z8_MELHA
MNNNHAHMNGNSTAHGRVRPASHAGSWYSDTPTELDQQLSGWLSAAGSNIGSARAIISPRPLGSFKIVPILVGSLSTTRQQFYGRIFANYIADPTNLFVISSDFCHWGQRFRYTPMESTGARPIHEQITTLDKQGMDVISSLDPSIFNEYLKKTQNTICGRNPICVLLQAFDHYRQTSNPSAELRFLKYAQSNKVRSMTDSSVSYAAGALFINPRN